MTTYFAPLNRVNSDVISVNPMRLTKGVFYAGAAAANAAVAAAKKNLAPCRRKRKNLMQQIASIFARVKKRL